MPTILQAASPSDIAAAREIIREYGASLDVDLGYQHFDHELAQLPGDYAPPRGRLLLARCDQELAGCIALRSWSDDVCEMKRLYVRPAFRGQGLGKRLAIAIVAEARACGYRGMQLDSLPSMHDAVRLYRSLGFEPCAPYYATPVAGTVFLRLVL